MRRCTYMIEPRVEFDAIKIIPVARLESSYSISRAGVYFSFRKCAVGVVIEQENKRQFYCFHTDISTEEVFRELPQLKILLSE